LIAGLSPSRQGIAEGLGLGPEQRSGDSDRPKLSYPQPWYRSRRAPQHHRLWA
jgi:hypothetical protein